MKNKTTADLVGLFSRITDALKLRDDCPMILNPPTTIKEVINTARAVYESSIDEAQGLEAIRQVNQGEEKFLYNSLRNVLDGIWGRDDTK